MSNKKDDIDWGDLFSEDDDIQDEETSIKVNNDERFEKFKEVGKKILIFIVAVLIVGYLFTNFNSTKKDESPKNDLHEQEAKESLVKEELIKKYEAILMDDKEFSFSKDIQNSIENKFILQGTIYDIFRNDEKTFIKIEGHNYFGIFEINNEQEGYIRNAKNEYGAIYNLFIVVQLNSVSKSLFDVEAENDGEDIWTYINPSEDFFLKGQLIDVKKSD